MSYVTISVISWLLRQFFVPNPFQNIFQTPGKAEIANSIFGAIFIFFAFTLTGIWYLSGRIEKGVGSLIFFINYCVLTGLFVLISEFINNIKFILLIFGVVYIILYIVEVWLLNRYNSMF